MAFLCYFVNNENYILSKAMQFFIPDRLALRGIKTTPNAGFEQGKDGQEGRG